MSDSDHKYSALNRLRSVNEQFKRNEPRGHRSEVKPLRLLQVRRGHFNSLIRF